MSRSTLYSVFSTTARAEREYSNSHGTAPAIWGYLCAKYLGKEEHSWLMGDQKALWALAQDERVPVALRLAHALCFDYTYCPLDKMGELAQHLYAVGNLTKESRPQYVNHWHRIADDLGFMRGKKLGKAIGIGLGATSVSDPWESFKRALRLTTFSR